MAHSSARKWPLSDPIDPDWTCDELLDRLADDSLWNDPRWNDEACRRLARIEAAASGAAGAAGWTGAPGAVALARSLDALRRALPGLGAVRVGELLAAEAAAVAAARPVGEPASSPAEEESQEDRLAMAR